MTEPTYSPEALAFFRRYAELATESGTPLLATTEGRVALTRDNPMLFALVYLRHHLSGPETNHTISFSEMHHDWYSQISEWSTPTTTPMEWRRGYVAPRHSAKTTTWFLIAPMWAAAHQHIRYVAAFADSAYQAETHLATFKHELETNELLKKDYPELCSSQRTSAGTPMFNSRSKMVRTNGFVFEAKGADSSILGMKHGNARPDLIIVDDIEPSAENYSPYLAEQRLNTLQNSILYINTNARVVAVGTVVMDGSIIHQLVQHEQDADIEKPRWVIDEKFNVWYYPGIVTNDDGTERSLWPERWSLDYLQSIRTQRSFWLNFMNSPMAADSLMWSKEDIAYGSLQSYPVTILSIDPAVTSKKSSDFTGLAVLGADHGKVYVRDAYKVKLSPKALRHKVSDILQAYPEISVVLVETNQGGDVWAEVFADLPVRYVEKKQSVKKEVRANWLLDGYQNRRCVHTRALPDLENELLAFPRGLNDDLVDAVGTGFTSLTGAGQPKRVKPRMVRNASYV